MRHPGVLLKNYNLRATRRRGQNFLIQEGTAQALAASAGINPQDVVLEIGPGLGALTLALAPLAAQVVAVEIDRGLHQVLGEILAERGLRQVDLRLADALNLDWNTLPCPPAGGVLRVAANLPYALSSPILFTLLEQRARWRSASLLLQKEFAERLLAHPGSRDYGRLSVMAQCFCELKPGAVLGAEQFFPHPEVSSMMIHLYPRATPLAPQAEDQECFGRVVKAAFSQRRKTLRNSLANGLACPQEEAEAALAEARINPARRAETLSVEEFGLLTGAVSRSSEPN